MVWTILHFSKYEGYSLPQTIFLDPDWFFWSFRNNVFRDKGVLAQEALEVYRRARSIRIPESIRNGLRPAYFLDSTQKKYSHFELVSKDQPPSQNPSYIQDKAIFDLDVPRSLVRSDKRAGRNHILEIIELFFGNKEHEMTKEQCEDFFNDKTNFTSSQ